MVKHSVLLVVPNVAAISSFRWVPRTAICRGRAASGLSIAVRLAGPRADAACRGPGLGPGPAHLPGSGAVERRPNRGDSPATGLPSAGRAGHLRVRDGYDQDRSPLYYLVAAAPLLLRPGSWLPEALEPFLTATPYLFFGVMLGASLWYVARRLYGNAGGYIALALYCFSPAMIV